MQKLSIVIITLNEEKNIKRCLDSLENISDDIIVIDSKSNDNTIAICEEYPNIKIFTNDFLDYSQQRNYGTSKTKYNYVFHIDADEKLSEELKQSLINQDFSDNTNIVYSFNRLNFYCKKALRYGGWYPDVKKRIWNKNHASWQGKVHEKLVFKDKPKTVHLKGDLFHYTYQSTQEHISQATKYSFLSAIKDFEKGKQASIFKIWLKPKLKFIFLYLVKLGFLDGYYGYLAAKISAQSDFKRLVKLREINKNKT